MSYNLKQPPFVIGMPTETVYGLAARIDLEQGIQAIFKIKERPFFDPLIVHVGSIEQAKTLVKSWPQVADVLARAFWPGPLTLILPKADHINPMITSGLETIGIRMPRHPLALQLIQDEGVPLAAPSANRFGRTSPTSAAHVAAEFAGQVPVLDGGPCEVGIESTVLLVKTDQQGVCLSILRPGEVKITDIDQALKNNNISFKWLESIDSKESPGHMKHHYMPDVPLVIVRTHGIGEAEIIDRVEKMISMLPDEIENIKITKPKGPIAHLVVLTLSKDPTLASRQLYAELRKLAAQKPDLILFYQKEYHQGEGWKAMFDRLTKAASLIV